jgi:hypothetical protein
MLHFIWLGILSVAIGDVVLRLAYPNDPPKPFLDLDWIAAVLVKIARPVAAVIGIAALYVFLHYVDTHAEPETLDKVILGGLVCFAFIGIPLWLAWMHWGRRL